MFKRRKMDNAAAMSLPQGQTINNYSPGYAGLVFAVFVCLLALLFIGWQFLTYLVSEMGYKRPVEAIGWGLAGLITLIILSTVIYWLVTRPLQMVLDYQLQIEVIRAETAKSLALTAGAPALPNERLTDEQKKLFENLAIVMEKAYRDYAAGGEYKGGNVPRPWSKAQVLSLNPPRHGRMSYMKASTIRDWLAEHQVIVGEAQKDQINREQFPTWADFRAYLEDQFNMPVQVGKALPYSTGGYEHIEG